MNTTNSRLTSTEITNLITQYNQVTMSICISKHVLATVKDSEIRSLFEFSLGLSKKHVKKLTEFFNKENFLVPNGFTENDVNLDAPPLFTDSFWLNYLHTMTQYGLSGYSLCIGTSARKEIQDFYFQSIIDDMEVYKKCVDILLSKGLYEKPPYFKTPSKVENIKNLGYSLDVIGKKRPINSSEAGHIYFNLTKTRLAKGIFLGFSQVAKNKEAREFFESTLKTINKNYGIFSQLLLEENLHVPQLFDTQITNSTVGPFSEKLMMFNAGFLLGASFSYHGTALIASLRLDLIGHCEAAMLRGLKHLPNFENVMIKNGWLEKLPEVDDRKELLNN